MLDMSSMAWTGEDNLGRGPSAARLVFLQYFEPHPILAPGAPTVLSAHTGSRAMP